MTDAGGTSGLQEHIAYVEEDHDLLRETLGLLESAFHDDPFGEHKAPVTPGWRWIAARWTVTPCVVGGNIRTVKVASPR